MGEKSNETSEMGFQTAKTEGNQEQAAGCSDGADQFRMDHGASSFLTSS